MQNESVNSASRAEPSSHAAFLRSEDIPEAMRADANSIEPLPNAEPQPRRTSWLWAAVAVSTSVLGLLVWQQMQQAGTLPVAIESSAASPAVAGLDQSTQQLAPAPVATPDLLGHFPYAEAPATSLAAIVSDGSIKLRQPAATRFVEMVKAANAQGVALRPLSGFRSTSEQEHLFFDIKAQRGQQVEQRAAVSAPPGYSEHHTGYAIDIGDGRNSATDLQQSFETTAAFRWLAQHAARYGFEMSFPRNNPQGITYEPWHWRFVGDRASLETFYRARSAQPRLQP